MKRESNHRTILFSRLWSPRTLFKLRRGQQNFFINIKRGQQTTFTGAKKTKMTKYLRNQMCQRWFLCLSFFLSFLLLACIIMFLPLFLIYYLFSTWKFWSWTIRALNFVSNIQRSSRRRNLWIQSMNSNATVGPHAKAARINLSEQHSGRAFWLPLPQAALLQLGLK